MTEKPVAEMTFEEAMAALEQVVSKLERGEVGLDESIALYGRGAELKAHCDARLQAAQEKIDTIRLNEAGEPAGTAPFEAG